MNPIDTAAAGQRERCIRIVHKALAEVRPQFRLALR